MKQQTKGT